MNKYRRYAVQVLISGIWTTCKKHSRCTMIQASAAMKEMECFGFQVCLVEV